MSDSSRLTLHEVFDQDDNSSMYQKKLPKFDFFNHLHDLAPSVNPQVLELA